MNAPTKTWTRARKSERGFTLAEVAVTIVIMGISLCTVLQGLTTSKLMAAHTRNYKLARELGLPKLEQIGSAIFKDDIKNGLTGTFAQEGYPEFSYEVVVGDESFRQKKSNGSFDSWAPRDSASDKKKDDKDKDKDDTQPFEKVKIRITYPKIQELSNELILERWYPWVQVYGEDETKKAKDAAAAAAGTNNGNTGSSPTGAQPTASSSGAKKP